MMHRLATISRINRRVLALIGIGFVGFLFGFSSRAAKKSRNSSNSPAAREIHLAPRQ